MGKPLGPIPWALATPDGSLRKTNKASLRKGLIQNVSVAEAIPKASACIIDGMNLVQRMNGENQTFAQLAAHSMSLALHAGIDSHII